LRSEVDRSGVFTNRWYYSATGVESRQVQPFSPTSLSQSRLDRGLLTHGEIPQGIVFNLRRELEAAEPGNTITGGPLPFSRRNSSARRSGTLEYIPKATFSNFEQKEVITKLANATATLGRRRWSSLSSTATDSRRRSPAFSTFSRSDSEEDSIPVKPRGPPIRNVETRSGTSSYGARTTRNKYAQAHTYGPSNALMISNCTEGQASCGKMLLSTGSSTAQSLSCSGAIHSTDYSQQPASPQTVSAELMAQLQALIGKIHAQTGQLVVPKLNVNMACEVSETAKQVVEMEVDVRLKYVSNNTIEHVGPCTQLREFLGVGSACAVMEELVQT